MVSVCFMTSKRALLAVNKSVDTSRGYSQELHLVIVDDLDFMPMIKYTVVYSLWAAGPLAVGVSSSLE